MVRKKLVEEQRKVAEVAKEMRQLEAAAIAAKAEAETAASRCKAQSSRTAVLLAEQQSIQDALEGKRTATQTQVCHTLHNSPRGPCSMVLNSCVTRLACKCVKTG